MSPKIKNPSFGWDFYHDLILLLIPTVYDPLEHLDDEVPSLDIGFHRDDIIGIEPLVTMDLSSLDGEWSNHPLPLRNGGRPLKRGIPDIICLHEEHIFSSRLIYTIFARVGEIVDRYREGMMVELASSVSQDLVPIHLEESGIEGELFSELTDHRIVDGFTWFYMSTREYPWGI
jgi:hypothetical protein